MSKLEAQVQIWADIVCGECAFYQPLANERGYLGKGFCKRFPPTPIKVDETEVPTLLATGANKGKEKQSLINSYQPVVVHNWPGCGEAVPMPRDRKINFGGEDTGSPAPGDKGGARA